MPVYKYQNSRGRTKWLAKFMYTDWTGKRSRKTKRGFDTKREAQEYESSFRRTAANRCDILFCELVDAYLEDLSHRLKPTTIKNKEFLIRDKIVPYFERLPICDIDSYSIRQWQNMMIDSRMPNGSFYSPTYLKTINNQLSAIMNYAVANYGLPSNPCRAAGSIGKGSAEEMNIWTQEQYETFRKSVKKQGYLLAFDILFYSGIRSGELLALTPADILPEKRIRINKNFAVLDGEELILEPKTSASKRTLSIPDFLYNDIKSYVGSMYGIEDTERIFYFTRSGLTKEFHASSDRAGLPRIRLHDLRHSHASMLVDMGCNVLEISKRLGHHSVKTTLDTYSHLYPHKDERLADAINAFREEPADPTEGMTKWIFCQVLMDMKGRILEDFVGRPADQVRYEDVLLVYDSKSSEEIARLEPLAAAYYELNGIQGEGDEEMTNDIQGMMDTMSRNHYSFRKDAN